MPAWVTTFGLLWLAADVIFVGFLLRASRPETDPFWILVKNHFKEEGDPREQ